MAYNFERYEAFEIALAELARLHGFLLHRSAGQTFWPTYTEDGGLEKRVAVEFEDTESNRVNHE